METDTEDEACGYDVPRLRGRVDEFQELAVREFIEKSLTHRQQEIVRFAEWIEVTGNERLTGAMLDRLTHKVHIIEANGESFRLKEAKRRRDSAPK